MKKKLHLEILRIIAIYFVILTHTGRRGFTYFTTLEPSLGYFAAMLVPLACQICVPLFYMISGATLLGKDETPAQVWRRRIPRILAVTVLASLGMYLYYEPKSGVDFLKTLYSRNVIAPYWYLWSYLGFLILLPFLRKMIRNLSDREFLYLFGLHLVFNGLIPMAQYPPGLRLNGSLNVALVTSNIIIFPAAGYYLERKELTRRHIAALWGLTVLALAATMALTHYKIIQTGQLGEGQVGTFYKSLCLIPTAAVYATVKGLKVPRWLEKPVATLGGCTFGIYLIEQILRERGYPVRDAMARWLPDIPATLVYTALVLAAAFCVIWAVRKLPGAKRLI